MENRSGARCLRYTERLEARPYPTIRARPTRSRGTRPPGLQKPRNAAGPRAAARSRQRWQRKGRARREVGSHLLESRQRAVHERECEIELRILSVAEIVRRDID